MMPKWTSRTARLSNRSGDLLETRVRAAPARPFESYVTDIQLPTRCELEICRATEQPISKHSGLEVCYLYEELILRWRLDGNISCM